MAASSAEQAVEQMFELYADDVYRYARSVLMNDADAKDVVQDVFCKALLAYSRFRHDSSAKTWLWQITRNQIRDVLRKRQREGRRRSDADLANIDGPENFALALELQDAIGGLNVAQREVVTLRMVQGLSNIETAQVLGWSEAKVKSTLHRAVLKLRQSLAEPAPSGGSLPVQAAHSSNADPAGGGTHGQSL